MQLAQSFDLTAPIDRVWQALIDVERAAPCLPGAAVTGRDGNGSYEGSFTVAIGPTSASYTGRLELMEVDEGSYRAMMHATGTDPRGQGGASATIVLSLSEAGPGATHVEVETDYRITGRLARFGRGGMIEDISERLLREFADGLGASLSSDGPHVAAAEPTTAAPADPEDVWEDVWEDDGGPAPQEQTSEDHVAFDIEPTVGFPDPADSEPHPPDSEPPPEIAPEITSQPPPWQVPEMTPPPIDVLPVGANTNVIPFVAGIAVGIVLGGLVRRRGR